MKFVVSQIIKKNKYPDKDFRFLNSNYFKVTHTLITKIIVLLNYTYHLVTNLLLCDPY
jgi:hypothetical protein